MKTPLNKISSGQLMLAVACFMQGSVLLSSFFITITKQDTWIAIIAGFLLATVIIMWHCWIMKKYPGKTLVQILISVLGPVFGRFLSILVIFYILTLATLNLRDLGNFAVGFVMPETPITVVMLCFVFVCAFAVRSGIETITRCAAFFVIIAILVTVVNLILNIANMDFSNFLPVMSFPFMKYVQSIQGTTLVLFGETVVFFMIVPSVKDQEKVPSAFFKGLVIGGITLFLILVRDIAVLGDVAQIVTLPTYEAIRLINLGNILSRMEILYAIVVLGLQFFKITVLLYAFALAVAQIFNLKSYRSVVFITATLMTGYALFLFESPMQNVEWGANTASFFLLVFEIIIPAILFIGIILRLGINKLKGSSV